MKSHARLLAIIAASIACAIGHPCFSQCAAAAKTEWIGAADQERVQRKGAWYETSFRYADRGHLLTQTDGSSLTLAFEGVDLMLRLAQHAVPAYGRPALGELAVSIDDGPERVIHPIAEPREIVLARNLSRGEHVVRIEHRTSNRGASARIEALGCSVEPTGELAFALTGEHNAYLVDARAILRLGEEVIADRLVRNWLTGGCRLTGLPPGEGFRLELKAIGWVPVAVDGIVIEAGRETVLSPIHLAADPVGRTQGWLFPRIGRQAIRRPGENFRARFQANTGEIIGARIERRIGPATISRTLTVEEDKGAAFYYDREIVATTPHDTPPGLYDLTVRVRWPESENVREFCSPGAVAIVDLYPADPVFISWGHLDTQGQYQAEYLRDLAEIANLVGADMALMSTACNPAYIAGALSTLDMPYAVSFGNHQFAGFEQWFGPQESVIDFGPDLCVLNRSLPWHEGTLQADALLARHKNARIKVINAFEHNAPIDLLDRHQVALIHDAHGTGERVMKMGATPTLRVGKSNSESFRLIRFLGGRVASCTYLGDATAPIPFPRGSIRPLRAVCDPPADGVHTETTITISNDLGEAFPNCRVRIVMPAGEYACDGSRICRATPSDCGRFAELTLRTDVTAKSQTVIRVLRDGGL